MSEFPSFIYHSRLSAEIKKQNMENWMNNKPNLVFTTTAIGLGVNKLDVDLVIHLKMPKSLAALYQETGRCGRDGQFAKCILFYHFDDQDFLIFKARDEGMTFKVNGLYGLPEIRRLVGQFEVVVVGFQETYFDSAKLHRNLPFGNNHLHQPRHDSCDVFRGEAAVTLREDKLLPAKLAFGFVSKTFKLEMIVVPVWLKYANRRF